ncbi:MAG: hypothetical protein WBD07_14925 [Vicinamibacterales bacterium]
MAFTLTDWHRQLDRHFAELRALRDKQRGSSAPIFALEHGLSVDDIRALQLSVRESIANEPPDVSHALAWIVYATELGYRYSGDEYWQTFEAETPFWVVRGRREWIRECFIRFHKKFGGAQPTGAWAEHFSIICWPITHAILPCDLQRQLAEILHEIRHSFTAELLKSPVDLGQRIAARSWRTTSRFQNLSQETVLVGQIAAALLLEGRMGSEGLLTPDTLRRIGEDLDRERRARDWLSSARRVAQERVAFTGLTAGRHTSPGQNRAGDNVRDEISPLGVEPRLVLRPTDIERRTWDVLLEIPDLSPLLAKFPAFFGPLTQSRCVVAGAAGRPLARGRLLHGDQPVTLSRWPLSDEVLLQFEQRVPELEYLLRTDALLRPGPVWLFKIASDGLAYELRTPVVRPGQKYVVVTSGEPDRRGSGLTPIGLACAGAHGMHLDLQAAMSEDTRKTLRALGLRPSKGVRAWPAGLCAANWDGEGRAEWLSTEKPCIGFSADHPVNDLTVTLANNGVHEKCAFGGVPLGDSVFLQLPVLPPGLYKLKAFVREDKDEALEGELEVLIKEPCSSAPGTGAGSPLSVQLEPPVPSLEQLWEGHVDVDLMGPAGRQIRCSLKLFGHDRGIPILTKDLPILELPITSERWRGHFEKYFHGLRDVQFKYDLSKACEIIINAGEFGVFSVVCEREFTPLRWVVRRDGDTYALTLLDDTGSSTLASVARHEFESPEIAKPQSAPIGGHELVVPNSGGMYVARHADTVHAVIVPPAQVSGLAQLRCVPSFRSEPPRSVSGVTVLVNLIGTWSRARLVGDPFSSYRQRDVRLGLTRHLFAGFGGGVWKTSELEFERKHDLERLARAVSPTSGNAQLARSLFDNLPSLCNQSQMQRVRFLAQLTKETLRLPVPMGAAMRLPDGSRLVKADRENPKHPDSVSELALRLASAAGPQPASTDTKVTEGLKYLLQYPALSRAARFMVLAVDYRLSIGGPFEGTGSLYLGWNWTGR